ncbi:MAG: LysE family translocator [Arenicellales bacterium]
MFTELLPTLYPFLIASIALTLIPGPDNLFVLSISALHGSKAGVPTALGMATGNFVHTLAVALGLSAVISASPQALNAIKILGLSYLLWLAWQSWHASNPSSDPTSEQEIQAHSAFHYFKRGALMNILNPKVVLFFLAFFPQFIPENSTQAPLVIFILGTVFVLQAAIIFSLIALMAGRLQVAMSNVSPKVIAGFSSAIFVLLAVYLGLSLRL